MHLLTSIFVAALTLTLLVRAWLALRQLQHVRSHRDRVPEPFAADITLQVHRKAADYTAAKVNLSLISMALDFALVLVWTLGGGLAALDDALRGTHLGPINTGVLVIGSFVLLNVLIGLPLSLYSTFGVEADFGFNRTTWKTYVLDMLKTLLLSVVLGAPLLYAALALMGRAGHLWWLYVWALWFGFSLFMTWAYPKFIAPLFNKFSPLTDEALKARIETLLTRCGFTNRGVFIMDGSTRSAHGNAYFTGFGANKRIVFFDTLMEKLEPVEIEAVLAHELGHFRLRHVLQRLLLTAVLGLAALALLGWLADQDWFYMGLGVPAPSDYAALLLFTLLLPPFLFCFEPLASAWSRRHEFQADAYARQQADGAALVRALVKLYRDNASTLTPDPLHSAFYDSHPPALLRIARLQTPLDATR
ncbi:MAG TPA: M48 family metallopeptidase [Gammaproteobacteria bacterium]|jgi:STE24 endopeptidase|nr:M48 family metallopeptidase [Gammaproteobacteria bacterium]